MLNLALAIAAKDLHLAVRTPGGFFQPLLLGLLLIFLFSLATPPGDSTSPQGAAAIFCIAILFCQVLVFHELYSLEEVNGAREALLLAPAPTQGIWLGKSLAGLTLLAMTEVVLLPATAVFLNQNLVGPLWPAAAALLLADVGMAALGSLLGALGQGRGGRESVLTIVVFPLMIPLMLAAVSLLALTFGAPDAGTAKLWVGVAGSFDAIFLAVGLGLFGLLYRGDE